MTEHQGRYVVRWLKTVIMGRQDRNSLLQDLKRWHILLQRDCTLRQLVVQVVRAAAQFDPADERAVSQDRTGGQAPGSRALV